MERASHIFCKWKEERDGSHVHRSMVPPSFQHLSLSRVIRIIIIDRIELKIITFLRQPTQKMGDELRPA